MRLPGIGKAQIDEAKIRDDFHSRSHPVGRSAVVVTVWILPRDQAVPRFVTAFPGDAT